MAKQIAEFEHLQTEDVNELETAAWFHDTGFIECIKDHEEVSCNIAHEYLKKHGWDDDRINRVAHLIKATKVDYNAISLEEKILKDADTSHLGGPDYLKYLDVLRKELRLAHHKVFSDDEWKELNLRFFEGHKFLTNYGKLELDPVKSENYLKILKM